MDLEHLQRFAGGIGIPEGHGGGDVVEDEMRLRHHVRLHVGAEAIKVPGHERDAGEQQHQAAHDHQHRGELVANREPVEHYRSLTCGASRNNFELTLRLWRPAAARLTSKRMRLLSRTNAITVSSLSGPSPTVRTCRPRTAVSHALPSAVLPSPTKRIWQLRASSRPSRATAINGFPSTSSPSTAVFNKVKKLSSTVVQMRMSDGLRSPISTAGHVTYLAKLNRKTALMLASARLIDVCALLRTGATI